MLGFPLIAICVLVELQSRTCGVRKNGYLSIPEILVDIIVM